MRKPSCALALAVALSASTTTTVTGFVPCGQRIRAPSSLYNDDQGPAEGALFEDYTQGNNTFSTDTLTINAQFGESVPLTKPASCGESVPLTKPSTAAAAEEPTADNIGELKQRNLVVTIASVFLAVSSYAWQFTHPVTPVQLLAEMQSNSAPLTAIGNNGKPTVVDFWAPWCENCKMAAPTLQAVEQQYGDKVNFVMVNGNLPQAWGLIERFGVDAIPHMALVSAEGDVETALIGPIPKRVLAADLDVMLDNAGSTDKTDLPYKMLDVFANRPEYRRIKFQVAE